VSGLAGGDLLLDDEITQPTVLYVVGADVYIAENIRYSTASGDSPSLVIIVQEKNGL